MTGLICPGSINPNRQIPFLFKKRDASGFCGNTATMGPSHESKEETKSRLQQTRGYYYNSPCDSADDNDCITAPVAILRKRQQADDHKPSSAATMQPCGRGRKNDAARRPQDGRQRPRRPIGPSSRAERPWKRKGSSWVQARQGPDHDRRTPPSGCVLATTIGAAMHEQQGPLCL